MAKTGILAPRQIKVFLSSDGEKSEEAEMAAARFPEIKLCALNAEATFPNSFKDSFFNSLWYFIEILSVKSITSGICWGSRRSTFNTKTAPAIWDVAGAPSTRGGWKLQCSVLQPSENTGLKTHSLQI